MENEHPLHSVEVVVLCRGVQVYAGQQSSTLARILPLQGISQLIMFVRLFILPFIHSFSLLDFKVIRSIQVVA